MQCDLYALCFSVRHISYIGRRLSEAMAESSTFRSSSYLCSKIIIMTQHSIRRVVSRLQALWTALARRLGFLAGTERDLRWSLPKALGEERHQSRTGGGTKKHKYAYIHTLRRHASDMQPDTCHRFVLWLPHLH